MTAVAASASWATSAAIAARMASSTSEPIRRTSSLISRKLLVEAGARRMLGRVGGDHVDQLVLGVRA